MTELVGEVGINKGEATELLLIDGSNNIRVSRCEHRFFLSEVSIEVVHIPLRFLKLILVLL